MKLEKAEWGPGPWQDEPDRLDWVDAATKLPCRILRGPHGSLCGYVGVSREHPAFGMGYMPVDCTIDENVEWWRRHVTQRVEYKIEDIHVHGGLTFAGKFDGDHFHWFGFDCSHAWDYSPGLETKLRSVGYLIKNKDEKYCDLAYVKGQVTSLAQQLAAIKREDDEQTGTG